MALDNGGEVSHGEPMEGGADLGVAARHSKMYVSMGAPNLYLEYLMDLEWLDLEWPLGHRPPPRVHQEWRGT